MKRVCSQLLFCAPDKVLRNTIVEQDCNNQIINLISLDHQLSETSHTLFYDGIISSDIISLNISSCDELSDKIGDYQYIQLSDLKSDHPLTPGLKPLILDFESNDISVINKILKDKYLLLSNFKPLDIIAGCTYYPNQYLNLSKELKIYSRSQLILWKKLYHTDDLKNPYLQVYEV